MSRNPKRNKLLLSISLEPGQTEALARLCAKVHILQAALLKEAVDELLANHRGLLFCVFEQLNDIFRWILKQDLSSRSCLAHVSAETCSGVT